MRACTLTLVLVCHCAFLSAQVTWDGGAGTNNWGDANNWNPNGVPGATQSVTIGNGATVVLNTNATVAALIVGGGTSGSLTLGNNNTDRTLTVSGSITVQPGAQLVTAGNGGNVLIVGGSVINQGVFDLRIGGASADITFNGTLNQSIRGAGTVTDLNRLTLNNTGAVGNNQLEIIPAVFSAANGFLTLTRGVLRMSGNYTFSNNFFNTASPVINADEGLWLNNPNVTVNGQNGNTQLSGSIRITAGTYNVGIGANNWLAYNSGASITIEGGALNITGALVANTLASTLTYNQSAGTLLLCTVGNTVITPFPVGTFEIYSAGSVFNMSGGSIIFVRPSISLSDYINYAGITSVTGGLIQFGNSGTPSGTLFYAETSVPVYNLSLHATRNPVLQWQTPLTVVNDVVIDAQLDASAFNQNLTVGRNWVNNNLFIPGTATVTFNSTTQPQTIGGTAATTFYNLTNTNTTAAGLSLGNAVTVSNVLTFGSSVNGKINLGANSATIASGGSIVGANASRYIITQPTNAANGRLRQNNLPAGSRSFPIGTATSYLPLAVTASVAGSDFSASVFTGTTTNGLPSGPAFSNRSFQVNAVWRVDRVNGTSAAHLRFDWFSNSFEGANFTGLANTAIGIWRYDGSNWLLAPSSSFTNNNILNFSSTSGATLSSFGAVGTGMPYVVANIFVLPSALKMFRAVTIPSGNRLEWELENASAFRAVDVEQSADGRSFVFLKQVTPGDQSLYQTLHVTDIGVKTWYRLRLETNSGERSYSDIIVAGGQSVNQTGLVLLQNPVTQQLPFRLNATGTSVYQIADVNGRIVQTGTLGRINGLVTLPVHTLMNGMYTLQVMADGRREVVRFLKQ